MKTFKSIADVDRLRSHPLHATVESLFLSIIADCPEYIPEDDGWLVLIGPGDTDRILDDLDVPYKLSEVPFEGVTVVDGCFHAVCLFLLSTGCRVNEALSARWEHFDLEHRNWTIPSEHSKSRKVRSIPLNDQALSILENLGTHGKYDHPFIGRRGKPLTTIHKVWTRLRNEAGLPHLRLHDLRHNYASFLINQGHTLYKVMQILGHSDPSVTQRYAHLSTKSLQAAADSASDAINGAMQESPGT